MRSLFRFLRAKRFSYEPLVTVEISRGRILHNLETCIEHVAPWGIAPVLKANAYGHGLIEVAHILDGHPHIPFLVVDSYFEALRLRNEHVRAPILVIGHTLTKNILESDMRDVAFAVSSLSQLKELSSHTMRCALHLKFDTGMHRQGIMPNELKEAQDIVRKNPHMRVDGICSHLADADGEDARLTEQQIAMWNDIVLSWRTEFPHTRYFHLSATAGIGYKKRIDANVGRLGIGLYGISDIISDLQPALSLATQVTALRTVPVGGHVGYNFTWKATRETHVATIPVGYYEGVDRRLSNKGFVQVKGVVCPIIGRVSMNMTTVDVTDVLGVKEGDAVEVISMKPEARNSIKNMARACDTIPYDILVHLPTTLKRVVV